ncbi:hypothetical protein [Chryseobacterium sp. MEBOG07]|uniref:hypothetical protein n=1 Tax=Chryseobacterium sp. MEBOG07 TaxID=2879939 RepID=UPI001F2D9878|nr:hypothetical protein [Chryseobacterium sp. MEBOG07]UKB78317.1 hypothetical protein LF886_17800 [Chryseobacterium sp. MEBOG07]
MEKTLHLLLVGILLTVISCNNKWFQDIGLENKKDILLKLINNGLSVSPLVAKSK